MKGNEEFTPHRSMAVICRGPSSGPSRHRRFCFGLPMENPDPVRQLVKAPRPHWPGIRRLKMSLSSLCCWSAPPWRDMSKGTTRKLSGSERLQIANHRSGRVAADRGFGSLVGRLLGLLVPNLLVPNPEQPDEQRIQAYRRQALRALARNSFERVVADLISPTELLSLDDQSAQRFLFRCFFVPQFAMLECSEAQFRS
jgi:hypothetical protein